MGAYAYPIQIQWGHLPVERDEIVTVDSGRLTLKDLAFVGDDPFSIHERDWQEGGGYKISVTRRRLETDAERDARVAKEEAYMAEYTRRQGASA